MTITQLITANDLEAMASDARFELYPGVRHPMNLSGVRSSMMLSNIGYELRHFVQTRAFDAVMFDEAGFVLERTLDTVLAPDVAFARSSSQFDSPDFSRPKTQVSRPVNTAHRPPRTDP